MKFSHRNIHVPKYLSKSVLALAILLSVACSSEPENPADIIITGGDILTMAGEQAQYVEALAIDEGKISFIGSKLEAEKLAGEATQKIDLQGSTLIPKIVNGTQQILVSQGISKTPNCWKEAAFNTKAELMAALNKAKIERVKLGLGLFCMGYVPNTSSPAELLTEQDLDAGFPDIPVILVDASLQQVLTNSLGKSKFSLDTYKMLKNAITNSEFKSNGFELGQSADFMILDKNPLKDKTVSLANIKITQAYIQGKPVSDGPKDMAMLTILDIFSAHAEEKNAIAKIDEMKAAAAAAEAEKQKQAALAAEAKAKAKASANAKTKTAAGTSTKKSATYTKGSRTVKEVPVTPPASQETTEKPKIARFNMTQDGKKMTAEDFDAWMKAQGIRIVPAKTQTAPAPAATSDGDK